MRGKREQHRVDRLLLGLALAFGALAGLTGAATVESAAMGALTPAGIEAPSLGTHFRETGFEAVEARSDGGILAQRGEPLESYLESYLPRGAADPATTPRKLPQYSTVSFLPGEKRLIASEGTDRNLTLLNADGSLDASFGGGSVKAPIRVQRALQLPSGKILVASRESVGARTIETRVNVALLNPDGSVDRGIGRDGILTVSVPTPSYSFGPAIPAIASTPDGGAIVVGGSFLLWLRADGSPVTSFGKGGIVGELPGLVGARALADGGVEAVGSGAGAGSEDVQVLRLTASGERDRGFGPDGIRKLDLGGHESARAASWGPDGSVVVGGAQQMSGGCDEDECLQTPFLVGFDPSGALEYGFGQGGVVLLSGLAGAPGSYLDGGVEALTRRPDGSLIAAGSAPPEQTVGFLAALSPQGALLPGFGEGGIARVRQPVPASQTVAGFARQPDGKLLAAATADVGFVEAPVLIRYSAKGALDRTFGGGGYVALAPDRSVRGFAVSPSGQVLVGVFDYPRSRLLLRNAADGSPVGTFGSAGSLELPGRMFIEALGFAPDGDAIVLARRDVSGPEEPGVVLRFDRDGQPDRGFGRDGRVDLRLPRGGEVRVSSLAIDRHGGILVGGRAGGRFALARLLPDGRADRRFGTAGWELPFAGGFAKWAKVRLAGSRIYLAGLANQDEQLRLALMRFDANGHPDHGFGRRGRLTTSLARPARAEAIVPARTGILIVLNKGPRPLLSFGRAGAVRRLPVGDGLGFPDNVRALPVGNRLLLGWNIYSRAERRQVYHLASRPLR
jgi:uncharacterized delta-60 repeat protein